MADEGGVAPLAREDPHGFRNRPWTAQAHASEEPASFHCCAAGLARADQALPSRNRHVDATGESNPLRRFAAADLSVWSVAIQRELASRHAGPHPARGLLVAQRRRGNLECLVGLAPD